MASIILKEIRGGWIKKYQVFLFFMLRQLKTTVSLGNGDEVASDLAISEANLCRGSTTHSSYSKKFFEIYGERPVPESLF